MMEWLALLNIVSSVPSYHDQLEAREVRMRQCIVQKTCSRHWDNSLKAWVIVYKKVEPKEVTVEDITVAKEQS